jgi:hypothetical protein
MHVRDNSTELLQSQQSLVQLSQQLELLSHQLHQRGASS